MRPTRRMVGNTRVAHAATLVATLLAASAGRSAEPPIGDLLTRDDALIEPADRSRRLESAAAVTDGDPSTAVELAARGGDEIDLAFSWGGAIMGLRRVAIGLDPGRPSTQPTDLEILVSPDGDGDRFSVVKSIALFRGAGPYTYDLGPVAAKRVLVRLRAPADGTGVRVTELALLGYEGIVEPRRAFKESPADALEVVATLQKMSLDLACPADEAAMLADGADGTFDGISFAEAALIASGEPDAAARASHLAIIDRLVADADRAVSGTGDLQGRGEAILRLLHAGPFKGGYALRQTDVSTVLETGRFNCVSSAVVYTIVGRRLGLDVRGIEVPEHAFAIVYDGPRHVDVETTIPEGFNPARSAEAAEKFRERTGFVYVPESHREDRREVNDAGLVALVYYNHGVARAEQGDHPGALAMYFRGLQLDPASASLVKNALAALTNWSKALLDAGAAADAVAVSKAAMRLAPDEYGIRTNARASFIVCAIAECDAGRIDEALAVLASGLMLLPHDHDLEEAKVGLFTRKAAEHVEHEDWQAALEIVAPGLERLEGRDRARLAEWCGSVRSRWAKEEIDAGRFSAARDILLAGIMQNPDDGRLADNLEYAVQEELAAAKAAAAESTAIARAVELAAQLPRTSDVPDVIVRHVHRRASALQEQAHWEEAEAYVGRHVPALAPLGDASAIEDLWERIYVPWAQQAKEDWDVAIERYVRGHRAAPGSRLIEGNLEYCLDRRARAHFEKDWPAAIKAYEAGMVILPGSSLLENNLRYSRQQADTR